MWPAIQVVLTSPPAGAAKVHAVSMDANQAPKVTSSLYAAHSCALRSLYASTPTNKLALRSHLCADFKLMVVVSSLDPALLAHEAGHNYNLNHGATARFKSKELPTEMVRQFKPSNLLALSVQFKPRAACSC